MKEEEISSDDFLSGLSKEIFELLVPEKVPQLKKLQQLVDDLKDFNKKNSILFNELSEKAFDKLHDKPFPAVGTFEEHVKSILNPLYEIYESQYYNPGEKLDSVIQLRDELTLNLSTKQQEDIDSIIKRLEETTPKIMYETTGNEMLRRQVMWY